MLLILEAFRNVGPSNILITSTVPARCSFQGRGLLVQNAFLRVVSVRNVEYSVLCPWISCHVPEEGVPCHRLLCRAVPCQLISVPRFHGSVPCQHISVPSRAVPCRAKIFRAKIFRAVPCRKSPGRPCRAVPGRPCCIDSLFVTADLCILT